MRLLKSSTHSVLIVVAGLAVLSILVLSLIGYQLTALAAQPENLNNVVTVTAVPDLGDTERTGEISTTITPTPFQPKTPTAEAEPNHDERNQLRVHTANASALEKSGDSSALQTPSSTVISAHPLPPEEWKSWPVIPLVTENARAIYQYGLATGADPHAFSILGDCQSESWIFMGVYETDAAVVTDLPPELQDTVTHFSGSFNRRSPTIRGGTTAGAILWPAWHGNAFSCWASESPLNCELRLHNPSIVFINLGTHFEIRNIYYLRRILDQLIERGVLPILSTKADNREVDEHLNEEMALLAVEYNIPLWNFYAAAAELPNNGVEVMPSRAYQGPIYLTNEGLELHRYTALQALAAVWQAVQRP